MGWLTIATVTERVNSWGQSHMEGGKGTKSSPLAESSVRAKKGQGVCTVLREQSGAQKGEREVILNVDKTI